MIQTRRLNLVPTLQAIAELAFIYAAECRVDGRALGLAAPRLRQRHRLNLHGIHPRQSSHAFLVERDGCAVRLGQPILFYQRLTRRQQLGAIPIEIECHQRTSSTGTCTVRIIAVVVLPTISVRSGEWP